MPAAIPDWAKSEPPPVPDWARQEVPDWAVEESPPQEADQFLAAQTPIVGQAPTFMDAPAPTINPRDIALESRAKRGPEIGPSTGGEPIPDPDAKESPSLLSELGVAPIGLGTFSKFEGKTVAPGSEAARARDLAAGEGRAPIGVGTPTSELIQLIPEGKWKDVATGTYNAAASLFNFFASPLGASMGGIGNLPVAAQRAVSAGFAYDMATKAPAELEAGDEAFKRGDLQAATQHWLGAAASLGFAGLAGRHATTGLLAPTKPPVVSRELQETAPLTARAVEEAIKNEPTPTTNETKVEPTVSEVTPAAPPEAKVEAPRPAVVGDEVLTPEVIAERVAAMKQDQTLSQFQDAALEEIAAGRNAKEVENNINHLRNLNQELVDALNRGEEIEASEKKYLTKRQLEIVEESLTPEQTIAEQVNATVTVQKGQVPGQADVWDFRFKEPELEEYSFAVKGGATLEEVQAARERKLAELKPQEAAEAEPTFQEWRDKLTFSPPSHKGEPLSALEVALLEQDRNNSTRVKPKATTGEQPTHEQTATLDKAWQWLRTEAGFKWAVAQKQAAPYLKIREAKQEIKPAGGVDQSLRPTEGGAETQGAIASVPPPMTPVPSVVSQTPKSQREIITALAKGLGVPIRFGRLRTSKFAGYFIKKANLIGAKRANDIPLTSHEVGHKLDALFDVSSNPSIRSELDVLGDPATPGSLSSWTKSKPLKYKMGEGLAEFVRYWLVDPPAAQKSAPNTFTEFNRILDANKDVGDVMRQAQEDIRIWRTAEPQARLRSHISVGSNPNKTRYTLSQLTRDLVDDLHFLRLAVDDAKAMSKTDIAPSENPYLLARNLRGSYGMAGTFIRNGVIDFKTKAVQLGTSLEDALKPVAGRINDFRDWIVAKQAQELHRQGKETGLLASDVDVTAAKFDSDPAFQDAFPKVKAWNNALLQYAEDAGLITAKSKDSMLKMYQDFVPFHRVFEVGAGEAPSVETSGIGRGLNVGTPGSLKQRRGSRRDIVDPLETMVKNAYVIITASEKAAINRAVGGLSSKEGMGKWVERVASPKELVRVELERIRKELEAAGADLTAVPDDLLMSFFRQSQRAPFGENIIRTVEGGESKFYRLNKDLFDTFNALDLEDSGTLIKVLSAPAQLLRSGVTLAPDFALANAMRDTFSAAVLSKYGAAPFEVTIRGVAAMLNNPKLVAEWAAAGGKSSVEATYFDRAKLQTFLAEKITKDLTPSERALVYAKSPLVALRWLTGISEEATRIGEYKKAYDALRKSGMPEGEARRQAAFEARDRQDFSKGGAKTKIVRHMAAFWNAQLQANVRLAQAFKRNPLRTTLLGFSFITIPKLLEQAVNWDDKDYWDRPQWERDLFFMIPIGKGDDGHTKFIRIPTPFELGVIFGTLPGRLLQWQKEQDAEAMKGFPALMLKQTVPNPIPQTLQTVFADFLSGKKGWDIWRGRTVVPESIADQPPELQWTEQTSLTARHLGDLLDFSPMKIDHIINSTSGGVGRQLTHQVADRAIGAVTGEEPKTSIGIPGSRFVSTPAAFSSQAIDDVYTTIDTLKTAKARIDAGQSVDVDVSWLSTFERTARRLSQLRKQSRAATSESEKQRINEQMLSQSRDLMERYKAAIKKP